jgi:hypothetical protein
MALELVNNGSRGTGMQQAPQQTAVATVSQTNQQQNTQQQSRIWLSNVVFDIFWIPPTLTFTASSAAGVGAVATTIYFFNTSFFNSLVTNNGVAGGLTNTYGDGFSGKSYERLFASAGIGRNNGSKGGGVLTTGFNLISTVASTGAQNATAFSTMLFNYIWSTSQGVMQPAPFDINSAISSGQYNTGIMNIGQNAYINCLTQITCVIPVDNKFGFTFLTNQYI